MAGAIIGGITGSGIASPAQIGVCDVRPQATEKFVKAGMNAFAAPAQAADFADIVFLSVKPQNYAEVLAALRGHTGSKVIVTIAAGISSKYIRSELGQDTKVVRVMPNTPLLLGCGATAICRCEHVTEEEFLTVKSFFEAGGTVAELPEEKMNAVISVNGSSPAYIYLFAKAVVDSAVKQGIEPDAAMKLIAQTLVGSAKMLTDSGKTPEELIEMVSSKGGTTIAALGALYEHGFEAAIDEAMQRCTKRAEELGR